MGPYRAIILAWILVPSWGLPIGLLHHLWNKRGRSKSLDFVSALLDFALQAPDVFLALCTSSHE